jgi:SAM-dependent methyltransferase
MMDNPTDFYDALAPMFDVMTDWDARLASEGPFLQLILEQAGAKRVLDAACGSGGHVLWLARQGYEVTGADVSPVMIALARQKAAADGLGVPFVVSDLANLQTATIYDAVLCLGNSLPHLLTQDDLVAALRGMAGVLRTGGALVLQNLNYDLRWQGQPRWFMAQGGVLDGQEVLVWRFADYDAPAGRIAFHIALFRKDAPNWQVEVHTTPHRPLFRADLLAALTEAGFIEPCTYGRMARPDEAFDVSRSGDLVVVAWKS